jgi:hypothetical protein
MLTETQEERLRSALETLIEAAPEISHLAPTTPTRRQRPGLVAVAAFVVVLAVFLPIRLIQDGSSPADSATATSTPAPSPEANTATPEQSVQTAVSFGQPVAVNAAPGEVRTLLATNGVLYASTAGPTDRVMASTDDGSTWETVLEVDLGDAEGLFGVGDLVVLVIEDDNPARDTVSPSSVVSEAPRVLIYDPSTGDSFETDLPRPEDPQMEGLSLDESTEGCGLGGYQSWVGANSVAVGDRLVVTGGHMLVGRLTDGTVICDGQAVRHIAWTSDDGGRTWELHEAQQLGAIAWTGEQYVGWSITDPTTGRPELVVSNDGVGWTQVASTPAVPEGSISVGTSIVVDEKTVVAWTGVAAWGAVVPEDVTDAEQLQDVLNIGPDEDVEETLNYIGVDLPLDDAEKETIVRFNGAAGPIGAVIGISTDGGVTWNTTYVSQPITGVAVVDGVYVALTSVFGDLFDPDDDSSSLLTSPDGAEWTHAIDLPEMGYGPAFFTVTKDAVYVKGEQTGALWKIPTS